MVNRNGIFRWMVLTLFAATIPAVAGANGLLRPGRIEVMTRNLYIGADVFRIAEAQTDAEIPAKVTEILAIVEASLPEERIDALARVYAATWPYVLILLVVVLLVTYVPALTLAPLGLYRAR